MAVIFCHDLLLTPVYYLKLLLIIPLNLVNIHTNFRNSASINSGLWWSPPDADWDELFPETWKAADVTAATQRLFERIPGVIARFF